MTLVSRIGKTTLNICYQESYRSMRSSCPWCSLLRITHASIHLQMPSKTVSSASLVCQLQHNPTRQQKHLEMAASFLYWFVWSIAEKIKMSRSDPDHTNDVPHCCCCCSGPKLNTAWPLFSAKPRGNVLLSSKVPRVSHGV